MGIMACLLAAGHRYGVDASPLKEEMWDNLKGR